MSIYDVRLNSDLQVKDPAVSNGAFDSRGSRQMCMQACPLGLLLAGIKEFREMTDEWLDFIIDCRSGKKHAYDIVIGAMADDQIYNYVSDYMDGSITREQFWVLAKFKYPTHQINFCTKGALKCLEYKGFEEVL